MHNVWRMGLTWDIRTGENSLGVGEWAASCCLYIPQRLMPSVTPQWQVTTTQITVSSDISHLKWIIKKGLVKFHNLMCKLKHFSRKKKKMLLPLHTLKVSLCWSGKGLSDTTWFKPCSHRCCTFGTSAVSCRSGEPLWRHASHWK